jgi:hypothetical protein
LSAASDVASTPLKRQKVEATVKRQSASGGASLPMLKFNMYLLCVASNAMPVDGEALVGLRTILSDGYGRTIDSQVTDTVHLSTVCPIVSAKCQWLRDGYGYGCSTVYGRQTGDYKS